MRSVGTHRVDDDFIALFEIFARDFDEGTVIKTGPHHDRG
jgi:hypothetical protein